MAQECVKQEPTIAMQKMRKHNLHVVLNQPKPGVPWAKYPCISFSSVVNIISLVSDVLHVFLM